MKNIYRQPDELLAALDARKRTARTESEKADAHMEAYEHERYEKHRNAVVIGDRVRMEQSIVEWTIISWTCARANLSGIDYRGKRTQRRLVSADELFKVALAPTCWHSTMQP